MTDRIRLETPGRIAFALSLRKTPERLTGGYFGVRRADYFTPEFNALVRSCSSFTDLTAGTGQYPYFLASSGFPVNVNDRCFYVGCLLRAIFNKEGLGEGVDPKAWIVDLIQKLDPNNVPRRKGSLTTMNPHVSGGPVFNRDVQGYVDAIAHLAMTEWKNPAISYAIGKTLMRWTFRGRQFVVKDVKGRRNVDTTPGEFFRWLLEELWDLRIYSSRLNPKTTKANLGDALEGLDALDVRGGFVYIDPAWPYSVALKGKNPYAFHSLILSEIIAQQKQTAFKMWEIETSEEGIMKTVEGWMRKAFDKGAKMFCACTQSTNFPDPEAFVYPYLEKRFQLVKLLTIDDWSSAASTKYINYWGIYKGVR